MDRIKVNTLYSDDPHKLGSQSKGRTTAFTNACW